MPIQVTCPNPKCLKRFTVEDKWAGKKGPCPKCKQIITVPKKEDELIIHAPDHSEAGSVDASGRNVLKTYKRKETKFQPLLFTAVIGAVLVALLTALVIRSAGARNFGSRRWPLLCLVRHWRGLATRFCATPNWKPIKDRA